MDNRKLVNLILGSMALAILHNDIFLDTIYSLFIFTDIRFVIEKIISLISFIGIILVITFSFLLIKNNIKK